jgi:hypothetical protein
LLMPALDGQTLYGLLQRHLPALCQRMIFLTGDTLSPDSMRFVEQCGHPGFRNPVVSMRYGLSWHRSCLLPCTTHQGSTNKSAYGAGDPSKVRCHRRDILWLPPRMTATGSPHVFAPPLPMSTYDLPCP